MKSNTKDVNHTSRIVAHIDMDCFYCQVERVRNPSLLNQPIAVVQYNPFGDLKTLKPDDNRVVNAGSIIAVSYEARAKGVKRSMRGAEAKKVCPEITLVQVPTAHAKADLTIYREAGDQVVKLIQLISPKIIIEKASIDEVYLDISQEVNIILSKIKDSFVVKNSICTDAIASYPINSSISVTANSSNNNILASTSCSDRTSFNIIHQELFNVDKVIQYASISWIVGDDMHETQTSKREVRNGYESQGKSVNTSNTNENIKSIDMNDYLCGTYDYQRLLCGAALIAKFREIIYQKLHFTCSGGIAHNKMLAKIASSMHKPNKQTLVPNHKVIQFMENLPISRVQGFGGNFGEYLSGPPFNIKTFKDLKMINKIQFLEKFDEATYIRVIASSHGLDTEEVKSRCIPLSLACGKSFRYSNAILVDNCIESGVLNTWLIELSTDLHDRVASDIKANSRKPKLVTVHVSFSRMNNQMKEENLTNSSNNTLVSIKSNNHPRLSASNNEITNNSSNNDVSASNNEITNNSNNNDVSASNNEITNNSNNNDVATPASHIFSETNNIPTTRTITTTTATVTATSTTSIHHHHGKPSNNHIIVAVAYSSSSSNSSNTSQPPLYITYLALTASNFEEFASEADSIAQYFSIKKNNIDGNKQWVSNDNNIHIEEIMLNPSVTTISSSTSSASSSSSSSSVILINNENSISSSSDLNYTELVSDSKLTPIITIKDKKTSPMKSFLMPHIENISTADNKIFNSIHHKFKQLVTKSKPSIQSFFNTSENIQNNTETNCNSNTTGNDISKNVTNNIINVLSNVHNNNNIITVPNESGDGDQIINLIDDDDDEEEDIIILKAKINNNQTTDNNTTISSTISKSSMNQNQIVHIDDYTTDIDNDSNNNNILQNASIDMNVYNSLPIDMQFEIKNQLIQQQQHQKLQLQQEKEQTGFKNKTNSSIKDREPKKQKLDNSLKTTMKNQNFINYFKFQRKNVNEK